jgi:hypothetical protein
MNASISVTILLCSAALMVVGVPLNFEDLLVEELAKRNSVSF